MNLAVFYHKLVLQMVDPGALPREESPLPHVLLLRLSSLLLPQHLVP